jgi:endonuclease YncB( thermonuclease family)
MSLFPNKILTLLLVLAFGLALRPAGAEPPPYPGKFEGHAGIADGDSLWLNGEEMRLLCIDAVELHQDCDDASGKAYPCGPKAKEAMAAFIKESTVTCYGHERDKYNRPLVYCRSQGRDLNRAMVQSGWAIATCPTYRPDQRDAKTAGRGIWQGRFLRPATWRKKHPWHKEATENTKE